MRRKFTWVTIGILLILSMVLAACSQSTTTTTSTTTQQPVTTTSSAQPPPTSTSTSATPETTAPPTTTTVTTANWWDKFGTPVNGGTLNYSYGFVDVICDPAQDPRPTQFGAYMESLFSNNMTLDRSVYPFQASWVPLKYLSGWLAKSWTQTDPTTITVTLNQGIHWQNKPPTNGREFTADDVVFAFDRALGTGNGFTTPNPFFGPGMAMIKKVVATDKYTVQFQLNTANPMAVYEVLEPSLQFGYTAPEWWALSDAQKKDYHYVTGTGAYILSDFVTGTSIKFEKNPDYWDKDPRYPQNKLPYLSNLNFIAIPDMATQVAAFRTGKTDMIVDGRSHVSADQANAIMKTNPDTQLYYWITGAGGVTFKYGAKPFDDIKVREAMQLCVDTNTIAKQYYKGLGDPTPVPMATSLLGPDWSDPYSNWPAELQQQYTYNLDKARQLMTAAGYPNGFKTEIYASAQDDINLAQVLKAYFEVIGVDATIKVDDPVTAGYITRGSKYTQMVLGGGGGFGQGPSDAMLAYYSKNAQVQGGVNDPTYDSYYDKYMNATTMADCQADFKEASRYVMEQHWSVNLGSVKTPQIVQAWVKGWDGEEFWNVPQWRYYSMMWTTNVNSTQ